MRAEKKVIEGIIPVTTTSAVYLDGTNKTLQEALESGEFGGNNSGSNTPSSGTTNAKHVTDAYLLINDAIFTVDKITKTINFKMNKKITLNRLFRVHHADGSVHTGSIELPNNVGYDIPNKKALIYTPSTDTWEVRGDAYGGFNMKDTEVLFGLNWEGRITAGLLRDAWDRYYPYYNEAKFGVVRNVNMEVIPRPMSRSLHSMFIYHDKLVTLECYQKDNFGGDAHIYTLPDLTYTNKKFYTKFIGTNADGSTYDFRLVTCDYNNDIDALIMGNSTSTGREEGMYGYIFYDVADWFDRNDSRNPVNFETCGRYTKLDFFSEGLFPNQVTAKIIWGEIPDTIYLTTSNLQYCHKILLGKGSNRLPNGTYDSDTSKKYNGTYKVIKTYEQPVPEVGNKDIHFYDGALYYTLKYTTGGYRLAKTYLCPDGSMNTELILYDPLNPDGSHAISGSPEGVVVHDGKFIGAHAGENFYIYNLRQ